MKPVTEPPSAEFEPEEQSRLGELWSRHKGKLTPVLGLVLFAVALWVLRRELHGYHYRDIKAAVERIPAHRIALGMVAVVASYTVLTFYDTLALHYSGRQIRYSRIAFISFVSYALSHNIGLSLVSGGSIRYRLYSSQGLSALDIARVVAFNGLSFWVGFLAVAGAAFVVEPPPIPAALHLPMTARPLGLLFLLVVGAYVAWGAISRKPLHVRGFTFEVPNLRYFLLQLLVATADWAVAGLALYVLLPSGLGLGYFGFLAFFLLAQLSGVASQVPGGLGVFETLLVLMLQPYASFTELLAPLLLFRLLYYLVPLALACVLFAVHEIMERREHVQRAWEFLSGFAAPLIPNLAAFAALAGGAILLFSGATPAIQARVHTWGHLVPLPVIEASHLFASVAGVCLLLLGRGLQRRLDSAWLVGCIALAAGIVFSVLKALDYEEALILSVFLALLLPSRRHFYRRGALLNEPLSPGWVGAVLLVIGATLWLGLFAYKYVAYSHTLWWQFALERDAPRFLRASVAVVVVSIAFGAARLLRPAPPDPKAPTAADLDLAAKLVSAFPKTYAFLALLGDKELLFNEQKTGFVMYGVEKNSFVSMGDPVASDADRRELVWEFRELADRHGGWTIFYQVCPDQLPLYIDVGLALFKLGEEALVPLQGFSLEGPERRALRTAHRKAEKEGCRFELVPKEAVPAVLDEVRAVSDAWLSDKNTREKGFSLGRFDPAYLRRMPLALVRHEDRIVGFANVLNGGAHDELSVDLMRHLPDAPRGVMDYLFIELMLHGAKEGYRSFNLGMAPLSGLGEHPLGPWWNKVGGLVYRHGEHFYNFSGLRGYKDKFDPRWEPRYVACPGGLVLPQVLANVAALVSRGLKGVVMR